MTEGEIQGKLDRVLGQMDMLIRRQEEQNDKLDEQAVRLTHVEAGVTATHEVVAAWAAAKVSMRFMKWVAGFIGAAVGMFAALKGWLLK